MLPPVSLPIENATSAAAVAAPGPALDPDAPSSSSHGFIVWPPNQMSFSASAPSDSLAISTAPASFRRAHHRGVRGGNAIAERFGAVGRGDVLRCRGDPSRRTGCRAADRDTCRRRSRRRALRARERVIARQRDDGAELRIEPLDALQIDAASAVRRSALRARSIATAG